MLSFNTSISTLKYEITKRIKVIVKERTSSNSPYVNLKDKEQIIFTRMHTFPVNQYGLAFEELLWLVIENIGSIEVGTKILSRSKSFFTGQSYHKNQKSLIINYSQLDVNTLFLIWQTLSGNFNAKIDEINFESE